MRIFQIRSHRDMTFDNPDHCSTKGQKIRIFQRNYSCEARLIPEARNHSCDNESTMSSLRVLASGTRLSHEIEIKRSRFIASIARTDTPEEAREFINSVKDAHPQARHNCSAWMIAEEGHSPSQHSSDDGEPSGTAGTPMLDVLKRNELWNVTVVATRYFGGILLGAGGLVRAYSSATSEALARALSHAWRR